MTLFPLFPFLFTPPLSYSSSIASVRLSPLIIIIIVYVCSLIESVSSVRCQSSTSHILLYSRQAKASSYNVLIYIVQMALTQNDTEVMAHVASFPSYALKDQATKASSAAVMQTIPSAKSSILFPEQVISKPVGLIIHNLPAPSPHPVYISTALPPVPDSGSQNPYYHSLYSHPGDGSHRRKQSHKVHNHFVRLCGAGASVWR